MRSNHTETINAAKAHFATLVKGTNSELPVDLRFTVYYAAIRYGGVAEYEQALALYRSPDLMQEERIRLMRALGIVAKC